MKKYKLIKEYPGSPSLNTTIQHNGIVYINSQPEKELVWLNPFCVERYPDYWQEIIEPAKAEKDYEILSFKKKDGYLYEKTFDNHYQIRTNDASIDHFRSYSKEQLLWLINIHSVKRLSDGEIFTIGDKVSYNKHTFSITKFDIIDNNVSNKIAVTVDNHLQYELNSIQYTKQLLFKTEEGVDIYEGDRYWFMKPNESWYMTEVKEASIMKMGNYSDIKRFSTIEAGHNYIIENKPCLSYRDVENMYNTKHYWMDEIKELVKQKLKL